MRTRPAPRLSPRDPVFGLIPCLLLGVLACSKSNEMVPYGAEQQSASPGAPNIASNIAPSIKRQGPVKVQVTPPSGATGPVTPVSCADKPEKVVGRGLRSSGSFGGVQVGDGNRVILRQKGKVEYYRLADDTIAYFFLAHKGLARAAMAAKAARSGFDVVFDSVDVCIPEAGGYVPSQRMTAASFGPITHTQWWETLDPAARAAAKAGFQQYVDDAFAK